MICFGYEIIGCIRWHGAFLEVARFVCGIGSKRFGIGIVGGGGACFDGSIFQLRMLLGMRLSVFAFVDGWQGVGAP